MKPAASTKNIPNNPVGTIQLNDSDSSKTFAFPYKKRRVGISLSVEEANKICANRDARKKSAIGRIKHMAINLSCLDVFRNSLHGYEDERREISAHFDTKMRRNIYSNKTEKVNIESEQGILLDGYYHKGDIKNSEKKVVLFLAGSGSPTENQSEKVVETYKASNISVLTVNYRGYGKSTGNPDEKGMYRDAEAMYNFLVDEKGFSPNDIFIHGYSLGAPVAAHIVNYASSRNHTIAGVVFDRPMSSMREAVEAKVKYPGSFGKFKGKLLGRAAKFVNGSFSVKKNLKHVSIEAPVLLMTDGGDLSDQGKKLRKHLGENGYQMAGIDTQYNHTDPIAGKITASLTAQLINSAKRLDEEGTVSSVERVTGQRYCAMTN